MGKVVDLKPEHGIWFCHCGSYTYKLRDDCAAICAVCGNIEAKGLWAHDPREADEPIHETPDNAMRIRHLGTPEIALAHVIKRAHVKHTSAVVVFQSDGTMSVWGEDFSKRKRQKWLQKQWKVAQRLLHGRK